MYKLPDNFNWKNYLKLNPDLKIDNETRAQFHFMRHGLKEKRKYLFEDTTIEIPYERLLLIGEVVSEIIYRYTHRVFTNNLRDILLKLLRF